MKKHLFIFKVYIIFWYLFFSNNCINGQTIYDFNKNETFNNWMIINDDVMGGVSNSNLSVDQNGNAVFLEIYLLIIMVVLPLFAIFFQSLIY